MSHCTRCNDTHEVWNESDTRYEPCACTRQGETTINEFILTQQAITIYTAMLVGIASNPLVEDAIGRSRRSHLMSEAISDAILMRTLIHEISRRTTQ